MPSTAAISVNNAIQASSSPAVSTDTRSSDAASAFDSHLDAARKQSAQPARDTPDRDDAGAAQTRDTRASNRKDTDTRDTASNDTDATTDKASDTATAALAGKAANAADGDNVTADTDTTSSKDDTTDTDTLSVASAMLALLGQAMPAAASAATGGAAKVLAASGLKTSAAQSTGPQLTVDPSADGLAEGDATSTAATTGATANVTTRAADALAQSLAGAQPFKLAKSDSDSSKLQDLNSLLMAAPQPSTSTSLTATHALSIASPAGSAAFAQELGQQVAWLGNQDVKQAKIRLHPEDLGQVDVKVSVQHNGQVDVTFAAQHPAAVHALQQTLPQLDTLLAQHGLSLGQADVGQQQAGGDGKSGSSFGSGTGSDAIDGAEGVAERPASVVAMGLLDAFA